LALLLVGAVCGLTLLAGQGRIVQGQGDGCWSTDNEDPVPGDWTAVVLYDDTDQVSRSSSYAHLSSYSYKHHTGTSALQLSAFTYYDLGSSYREGTFDAYFTGDPVTWTNPGACGADDDDIFALTEWDGAAWIDAWTIAYSTYHNRLMFDCDSCDAFQRRGLGLMLPGTWQHIRVEWDLPASPSTGSIRVWLDGYNYVDAWEVPMLPAADVAYSDMDVIAAGPKEWHPTNTDEQDMYVDDVEICGEWVPDPTPVPTATPEPQVCGQYGHAAVINVDNDCSGVVRFWYEPDIVGKEVTSAQLELYVVAVEDAPQTVNLTSLVPLWGEMTCDWCRRTVGEQWAAAGASDVPDDRYPEIWSTIVVTGTDYWVTIPVDPEVVEDWVTSAAADPGVIVFNQNMTGKVSFASSEWYDATEDYRPRLRVWYED
jgi:hypothetical protein